MNRRRILAAGAVVALGGCVRQTADEPPSADALVREAVETRRGMTDLAARRVVTAELPDETRERTERFASRPPAAQRREILESTDPTFPEGSVDVTNREVTWEYDPTTDRVEKQYHPNKVDSDRPQRVLEMLLEEYRLGYEGRETVDGREAHVVETKPPEDDRGPTIDLVVGDTTYVVPLGSTGSLEELDVTRTVWIDDEYRYPIRERTVLNDGGETVHSLSVTYADLAIDEGLAPGTFTYDPPADAEVVTEGTEPDGAFASRDAAEAAVPYDLPAPDVPDAFELDRITVVDRKDQYGGVTATLWYDDPDVVARELYVTVREFQRFRPSALEEIEIDGRTAYLRDGRRKCVFWVCDGLNYEVSSVTGDEPLREIAASIGCP
ncbi:LolA family protein [Haloterrigena alkaliphila]|uniref:Outer membrane lipoprotein carrier protein LolA n=1 Tax=Haloterrigena alkaliphila TaxID=2816475 RepID=A0A8A2VCT1_9EURY|nr:outer membrane lipoprotein carrier protein LolA [Haloterrigena alkaliphila]QSW98507.1 DUF2092 domain-containing protein [Haloterrigena alkaliphila]